MQVLATGKNLDIGDALRKHLSDKLTQNVGKYFDGDHFLGRPSLEYSTRTKDSGEEEEATPKEKEEKP